MAIKTPPNGQVTRQVDGATAPGATQAPPTRRFSLSEQGDRKIGDIAYYVQTGDVNKSGSLGSTAKPLGTGSVNILKDYIWTLSDRSNDEIPYVTLLEYQTSESLIKQQLDRYTGQFEQNKDRFLGNNKSESMLDVYKEILPKEATGFIYTFPYFNKSAIELSTSWKDLADAGDAIAKLGDIAKAAVNVFNTVNTLQAAATSPSVGVQDRPKIFESHTDRTINISFTLFNTHRSTDYLKNKNFIKLFTMQNLFNKRDYITGIPPVFYDVLVPGQYYSYASFVSNLRIENLGNMRIIGGEIIPDAYQIEISLTEMVKPSKNQFESVFTGEATNNVETRRDINQAIAEGF